MNLRLEKHPLTLERLSNPGSLVQRATPVPWIYLPMDGSQDSTTIVNTGRYTLPSAPVINGEAKLDQAVVYKGTASLKLNWDALMVTNTNYVKLPGITNFFLWSAWTIDFWIYFATVPYSNPGGGSYPLVFMIANSGSTSNWGDILGHIGVRDSIRFFDSTGSPWSENPHDFDAGVWNHVQLTSGNSGTFNSYVNNVAERIKGSLGYPTASTIDFYLGCGGFGSGANVWTARCQIDEFKIWDSVTLS